MVNAVELNLSIQLCPDISSREVCRFWLEIPALTINIVNIDACKRGHHLIDVRQTFWAQLTEISKWIARKITIVRFNIVDQLLRYHSTMTENFVGGWKGIKCPISHAIAHKEAAEVDLLLFGRLVFVVFADLMSEEWHVYAGV